MSKFLDETGLSYFWSKVKTYLATNFLQKPSGGTAGQVLTKSETGETWGDVPKEILRVTFSNYNSGTSTFGTVTHNAKEIYQAQSEGKIVIACNPDAMFYAPLSTYYQYASDGDTQTYELHFVSGEAHLYYAQMYDAGGSLLAEYSYFGGLLVSAEGVTFDNEGTEFESTNVQAALEEIGTKLSGGGLMTIPISIPTTGWTENQQTFTVTGIPADPTTYVVTLAQSGATNVAAARSCGLYIANEAQNSLTLGVSSVPETAFQVYAVVQGVSA